MAVAVEAEPGDEPGFIQDLLIQIYENYYPRDPLPEGVDVESPWGSLRITASQLGNTAIEAYFDDMEFAGLSYSPLVSPVGILVAIRKCQEDAQRHLSALD